MSVRERRTSVGLRESVPIGIDVPVMPDPHYLQIWGDRYNDLPGLFSVFDDQTQDDVWLRFTWAIENTKNVAYLINLVFEEWINDSYYSDGTNWGYGSVGICVDLPISNLTPFNRYKAILINDFGSTNSFTTVALSPRTDGGVVIDGTLAAIIDLHIARTGLNSNRGGNWDSHIFVNGVAAGSGSHASYGDIGHNLGQAGIGGVVFGVQYGNYIGAWHGVGNVKVGTSQGADDILPTQTFDDNDFGLFNNSLDHDTGDGPVFEIISRGRSLP